MYNFRKALFKIVFVGKMICYKINYGKQIKIGRHFSFRRGFNLNLSSETANITIGDNVFFNNDCSLNCKKEIVIGDDCIFGENVKIYDHNHIFKSKETIIRKQGYHCSPVTIGNNCWIGSNVVILPGGGIGDNSIVGAGTIVSSAYPADSIISGIRETIVTAREERTEKTR